MNLRMITILGCAVAFSGALSARAANFQSEADAARDIERQPVQVTVKTRDLDLSSPAGATTMLQRIRNAALEACGASSFSVPDYRWAMKRSTCYHSSVGQAVASLQAPAVTRLYEQSPVFPSN